MKRIHINTKNEYDVCLGSGLLESAGQLIGQIYDGQAGSAGSAALACSTESSTPVGRRILIVSDDNVYPLYGKKLTESLTASGWTVYSFTFPAGEASKSIDTYSRLLDYMCSIGMDRSDLLASLGGGVTGDLSGFAAATYKRGIDYVQLPTSLIGMVDSSVGGKTAINLPGGKNMAGAFYQPKLVLCDTDLLTSLPEEEIVNGCGEIAKYGMLGAPDLLNRLADGQFLKAIRDSKENRSLSIQDIVESCIETKKKYVEADEFDSGHRRMLNLGHTFGHAIEQRSGYMISHGRAVGMGMVKAAEYALALGICSAGTLEILKAVLTGCGLDTDCPYSTEELMEFIKADKKIKGATLTMVLPAEPGPCILREVDLNKETSLL